MTLTKEDLCNMVVLIIIVFDKEKIAQFTLVPSLRFVNITIWSTLSCQTIDQKSTSVLGVGPVWINGGKIEEQ